MYGWMWASSRAASSSTTFLSAGSTIATATVVAPSPR